MPVPMEGLQNTTETATYNHGIASQHFKTSQSHLPQQKKKNKVMKALKRVSSHLNLSNKSNSMEDEDTKADAQTNGNKSSPNESETASINVPRSASFDDNNISDDTASENSLSVSFDSRSSAIAHGSLSDSNLRLSQGQGGLKSKFASLSPNKKRTGSTSSSKTSRTKFLSHILPGISTRSKFELFKKVFNLPDGEQPIADFACALHRDILVQGRLYLTQNWVCFYANIFRWETLVTMKWEDIIAITKEKTARVIPNALKLTTSTEKYFFSSFISQKHAYMALFRVWQNVLLGQPLNPMELYVLCTRVRKRQNTEADGEPLGDDAEETADEAIEGERMVFDEQSAAASEASMDNGTDGMVSEVNSPRDVSVSSEGQVSHDGVKIVAPPSTPDDVDPQPVPLLLHSVSYGGNVLPPPISIPSYEQSSHHKKHAPIPSPLSKRAESFFNIARRKKKPKRAKQSPAHTSRLDVPDNSSIGDTTDGDDGGTSEDEVDNIPDTVCPCIDEHEGKERINEVFPVDVDTLFSLIFTEGSDVMQQVYQDRNIRDVSVHPKEDDEDGSKSRLVTYTVGLNYAVGPKSSLTEVTERYSADNRPGQCYVVNTEAASHGVPYSDKFRVLSRYCITRCQGKRSRLHGHAFLKYTGHVFGPIKGMIVKSADDAMKNYFISLSASLQAKIARTSPSSSSEKAQKSLPNSKAAIHDRTSDSQPSTPLNVKLPETSISNFSFFSSFRFITFLTVVFLALLCMNSYLYVRLRELEKITFATDQYDMLASDGPRTEAEWQKLLAIQQQLHRTDIIQMKELVGSTVKLLQQVEGSVSKLYSEIDHLASSRGTLASSAGDDLVLPDAAVTA